MPIRLYLSIVLLVSGAISASAQPALWAELPGAPGDYSNYSVHLLDLNDSGTPGLVNTVQKLQIWYDQSQIDGVFYYQFGTLSGNAPWLSLINEPDGTLGVSVSSGSLGPGSYLGWIMLTTDNPYIQVPMIAVRLTIAPKQGGAALYSTDKYSIPLALPAGSSTPVNSQFALTYVDGKGGAVTTTGELLLLDQFTVGVWLTCHAGQNPVGMQPNSIQCVTDPTVTNGMPAGIYYGYATFADAGQTTAVTRELSLTVATGATTDPNGTDFILTYTAGKPITPQVIPINNGTPVRFTVSSDVDWIDIGGAVGKTPANITLAPRASRIAPVQPNSAPQTMTGHVTITGEDSATDQLTLNVQLTVQPSATVQPLGIFPSSGLLNIDSNQTPATVLTVKSTNPNVQIPISARAHILTPNGIVWLAAAASANTTPTSVSVIAEAAQLQPGIYIGYVVLSSSQAGISPVTVPVVYTVSGSVTTVSTPRGQFHFGITGNITTQISVYPSSLSFSTDPSANLMSPQTLQFLPSQSPGMTVAMQSPTFDGNPWLYVTPNSLDATGFPTVSIQNTANLPSGGYLGVVQVLDGSNVISTALVNLTVP